jgi:cell division protein FtsZ
LINLDFADVRTIMSDGGAALMSVGRASGDGRAIDAAERAIASPLLDVTIDGATGVLFNVTGGLDMTLQEVNDAAEVIGQHVDHDANIIFGAVLDPEMSEELRITVIATGFRADARAEGRPSLANVIDMPRRRRVATPTGTAGPSPSAPTSRRGGFDDDLEVPAFLRNRS